MSDKGLKFACGIDDLQERQLNHEQFSARDNCELKPTRGLTFNAATESLLQVHEGEETTTSRISMYMVWLEHSAKAWREFQRLKTEMAKWAWVGLKFAGNSRNLFGKYGD